jgi:hypothetical protein
MLGAAPRAALRRRTVLLCVPHARECRRYWAAGFLGPGGRKPTAPPPPPPPLNPPPPPPPPPESEAEKGRRASLSPEARAFEDVGLAAHAAAAHAAAVAAWLAKWAQHGAHGDAREPPPPAAPADAWVAGDRCEVRARLGTVGVCGGLAFCACPSWACSGSRVLGRKACCVFPATFSGGFEHARARHRCTCARPS